MPRQAAQGRERTTRKGERKGKGREGKERKGKGREGKGREGKGREGKGRDGKGREGKGREETGREGKGARNIFVPATCMRLCDCSSGSNATGLSSRNPPCSIAFFTVIERVYQSRYLHEPVAPRTAAA